MKALPRSAVLLFITLLGCVSQQCFAKEYDVDNTIFTTWLEDPTTTMTVQWLAKTQPYPAYTNEKIKNLPSFSSKNIPWVDNAQDFFKNPKKMGLYFPLLHSETDTPVNDLKPEVAFAWTEKELLVYIYSYDDEYIEQKNNKKLFRADSHGFSLMNNDNAESMIHVNFTSGKDPKFGKIRKEISDKRKGSKTEEIKFEIERKDISDKEYALFFRINWSALGLNKPKNKEIRIQYYQMDMDSQGSNTVFSLYPKAGTREASPLNSRIFKLTDKNTQYAALIYDISRSGEQVKVQLEKQLIDKNQYSILLPSGQKLIPTFEENNGREISVMTFRHPAKHSFSHLALAIENRVVGTIPIKDGHYQEIQYGSEIALKNKKGEIVENAVTACSPFHPSGAIQNCRLHFTNLKADQYYFFNSPVDGKQYSFRTAPKSLENPIVFAEGGDMGSEEEIMVKLYKMAGSWDPLFAFLGGDLAYANGEEISKWVAYLKLWSQHMRGPKGNLIPMLVTIGNHEVRGAFGNDPKKAPFFYSLFGGQPAKFTNGANANFDFGEYLRIIALDSGHTKHVPDQNEWLELSLKEAAPFKFVFPAYHVPAYPSVRPYNGSSSVEVRENWTPLFDKYKVQIVFEHHDHAYKRTHPLVNEKRVEKGVVYLGDGAWGRARQLSEEKRPYLAVAKSSINIIKVTLNKKKVLIAAYDENEKIIDNTEIAAKQ